MTFADYPDVDVPPPYDEVEDEGVIAERTRRLFPRIDWHALWADETEEEWLLEPLISARRLVSLYSPPKVGKSLLLLEVAVALSRGTPCLGTRPPRRVRVLYVDFENDPRGDVRTRLRAMGVGPDDLDHLDYLSFPSMAVLDSERGGLELAEAVHAYGSEVVVIDTVSRTVAGEENSNDTWLNFYRHTGLRMKQNGVAMIRLDHSGKDADKGARGGSAKAGDVDAVWRLTRVTEDRFRLECTDSRMQIDNKVLHLTRQRLPHLHHEVDGASVLTTREERIEHLIAVLEVLEVPADASRTAVKKALKERGESARTEVLAEVVRRRKHLFPNLGNRPEDGAVGTAGDNQPADSQNACSPPVPTLREQVGTGGTDTCSAVPPSIEGDSGQNRERDGACRVCGEALHPALVEGGDTVHPTCDAGGDR
ncbi:AAA family ATPase [Mobilicoccus pelagius]|uniref:AAA+ ATPase domain-containing protein n=1 Tax=Mobilicoccus pelagius NBRC 104925 TaxID=1089455 RepID=H5UN93_9MICO|nr:AAA family ATPase [Mobilicoccus pelagius]GAB47201.1 hypothetical protein MOPEL_007_00180 [Mobilicoccus pelagius NBRC 104925]